MKTHSLSPLRISKRDLAKLQEKAYPFPWYQLTDWDKVSTDREIWCPIYKQCLDRAADAHWKGFTCRFCPNFKSQQRKEARNGFNTRK